MISSRTPFSKWLKHIHSWLMQVMRAEKKQRVRSKRIRVKVAHTDRFGWQSAVRIED